MNTSQQTDSSPASVIIVPSSVSSNTTAATPHKHRRASMDSAKGHTPSEDSQQYQNKPPLAQRRLSTQSQQSQTLERRKSLLNLGGNKSGVGGATTQRQVRLKQFFRHGLWKHDQRVFHNRGLAFPSSEMEQEKWNLGIMLHITDKYNPNLDIDPDQSIPPPPQQLFQITPDCSVFISTIQGEATATSSYLSPLFQEADDLVKSQFAKKNITADLQGVLDDQFTAEIIQLLPPSPPQPLSSSFESQDSDTTTTTTTATPTVLAAAEFVLMRKYVWLDAIAVMEQARGYRLGSLLIDRVKHVAVARGKDVLCFGLNDVVGWYLRHGFRLCSDEFPEMPWHIGKFLVWEGSSTLSSPSSSYLSSQQHQQL